MIQNLVVALIVAFAALYVARKYLPSSWREKLVYLLARRGASQSKMAQWLNTESSCGNGCDTCKSCAAPEPEAESEPTSTRRVIKIVRR